MAEAAIKAGAGPEAFEGGGLIGAAAAFVA